MNYNERSDVFISYRRVNKEFAQLLDKAIRETGREVWIDWEDIPPGSTDFNEDIIRGIEGADLFIAVLSPEYLKSPYTLSELEHAASLHKKLIPIVLEKFDHDPDCVVPPSISHINWIYFTPHIGEENRFEEAFPRLVQAIEADLDHARLHTRFGIRAREWTQGNRDDSFLLRGSEILEAEQWLASAQGKDPRPTQLHSEYIFASRTAARSRQRRLLAGVSAALVLSVALSILSFVLYGQAESSRRESVRQQEVAEQERDRANRNADEAHSLALAAAAQQFEDTDPIQALALAAQAVSISDPPGGAQRVFAAVAFAPGAVRQIEGHNAPVTSVAYSPVRGEMVAVSGGDDGQVIVWDTETGEQLNAFKIGDNVRIAGVAISPDGTRVLAGGSNGEMVLWDRASGEVVQRFSGVHSAGISSVAFGVDPNNLQIVSGSFDQTLALWDVETGEPLRLFEGHTSWITDVAFNPRGGQMASASNDKSVILWDVETGGIINQFSEHRSWAMSVTFAADGASLLVGLGDNTIVQWDVSRFERLRVYSGHDDRVTSVAYNPVRKQLISASADGTLISWDARTGDAEVRFVGLTTPDQAVNGNPINDVVFSADGAYAISGAEDGTLLVWDVESEAEIEEPIQTFASHEDWALGLDFDGAGKMVTTSADETMILWEYESATPMMYLEGHTGWVNDARFYADGTRLISASDDRTLKIWNMVEDDDNYGLPIATLTGHTDWVRALDVSPDGRYAISASADGTLRLWDINEESGTFGETIRTFTGHENIVTSVAFNPDGTQVLSGSYDMTARLWDVETGEGIQTLDGHSQTIRSVAFSPDGTRVVTASDDRTLALWDLSTGERLREYTGHGDMVRSVAFNPDGTMLISGGADKLLLLWTVETGEILRTFDGHGSAVLAAKFTPDGHAVISASADSQLLMWRVDTLDELFELVRAKRIVRPLTCPEREFYDVRPQCDEFGNLAVITE